MLPQVSLTEALIAGQKAADCCDHWCRVGAELDNGTYALHHNHIGGSKTDRQRVHAATVLDATAEKLAERIAGWISALHQTGERRNLNEG